MSFCLDSRWELCFKYNFINALAPIVTQVKSKKNYFLAADLFHLLQIKWKFKLWAQKLSFSCFLQSKDWEEADPSMFSVTYEVYWKHNMIGESMEKHWDRCTLSYHVFAPLIWISPQCEGDESKLNCVSNIVLPLTAPPPLLNNRKLVIFH